MSSMLFDSAPNLHHNTLPTNPTLVNLQDAVDTSITALPTLPPKTIARKESIWHRFFGKIKGVFGKREKKKGKKDVGGEKEMEIGGPYGFQHLKTGGALGLRGGEEEWEDM